MDLTGCYLILDFDGVLLPGEELMDEYVYEICKEASDKYRAELFQKKIELIEIQNQLENERIDSDTSYKIKKELDNIQAKINASYNKKDQVLEETEPEYVNRIPYHDIYIVKNFYPGIVELVHKIHEMGIYAQIIVNTHVNAEREIIAKSILLNNHFPPVKFVPRKFHVERYYDEYGDVVKGRKPSDKVGKLLEICPFIVPERSTLVDNTKWIIDRGKEFGLRCFFVEKNKDSFILANPTLNPIPAQVILDAVNDTVENVHQNKVKKLIL